MAPNIPDQLHVHSAPRQEAPLPTKTYCPLGQVPEVDVYDAKVLVFVLGLWLTQLVDRVSAVRETRTDLLTGRVFAILEVVYLDESADHRPILVALCLLGSDQIGKRHQVY